MSKNEQSMEQEKFLDSLKENYVKRIEEVDAFSKRFTQMYAEVNTEYLYGYLNLVQHYLDLQKNYSNRYFEWHIPDFMSDVIKQNTETWVQAVQNVDSVCIEGLRNVKNNLKTVNKNATLCLQSFERASKIHEDVKLGNNKNELKQKSTEIEPIVTQTNQILKEDLQQR